MPTTLNLNDHKKKQTVEDVLEVKYGNETYRIPLGNTLTLKEYKSLKKAYKDDDEDAIVDFLSKYMGNDVAESLHIDELCAIFEAWSKATSEASRGLTPGES